MASTRPDRLEKKTLAILPLPCVHPRCKLIWVGRGCAAPAVHRASLGCLDEALNPPPQRNRRQFARGSRSAGLLRRSTSLCKPWSPCQGLVALPRDARHGPHQQPCPGHLDLPGGQAGGLPPALEVRAGRVATVSVMLRRLSTAFVELAFSLPPCRLGMEGGNVYLNGVSLQVLLQDAQARGATRRWPCRLPRRKGARCLDGGPLGWVWPAGAATTSNKAHTAHQEKANEWNLSGGVQGGPRRC